MMDRRQFQDDGKSKLVQEAKAMLRDGDAEEDKPPADENSGPKIKMGRIGKKKKQRPAGQKAEGGATSGDAFGSKDRQAVAEELDTRGNEAFTPEDIEFMRQAIQILCRSTNPLGKSIDFVTDDVDSMSKEFEHWRKEAITCN